MIRSIILDKRKYQLLARPYQSKRMFANKQIFNKSIAIAKSTTYNFEKTSGINSLTLKGFLSHNFPYIFQEKKAPKGNYNYLTIIGFEKFLRDIRNKKEDKETAKADDKTDKEKEDGKEKEEELTEEEEHDAKPKTESVKEDERPMYMKFFFNPENNPKWENWGIIALAIAGAAWAYSQSNPAKELVYMEFVNDYLTKNRVKNITIIKDKRSDVFNYRADIETIEGEKHYITLGSVDNFLAKIDLIQREMGKTPQEFVPLKYSNESEQSSSNLLLNFLIAGLFGLFMWQILKGRNLPGTGTGTSKKGGSSKPGGGFMGGGGGGFGGMMNVGKSNVTVYGVDKKIKTKFKHVAGLDNAKEEIMEFVDFLKNPKKYQKLGAKIPRGALLIGPPGTGKTLLAKATAGEANIPFLSISGSDFVEMFVGVGASRVRDLFKKARENAPSIIFIDEIDAVGKKRNGKFSGGNDERDNTLNQLLVEMDGFGTDSSVVVLAATNRLDILDSALLRPGRFDRTIEINLPNIKERTEIFKVHMKRVKMNPRYTSDEYAKKMATLTPGMSGADIHNVVNEGAILAARKNLDSAGLIEFEQATERVIGGLEKKTVMSHNERKTVAYHEAGHAVAGWFLENSNPLIKITIIPRTKGSLGFAQYLPEELSLYTTEQLKDMINVALGGRIAEELFFTKVTTGASDDLKKVTQIANGIVTIYGMSSLGRVSYHQEEGYQKPYSESTASKIDEEIKKIIDECYASTRELLESKRELIGNLAEKLLEKEVVTLPDIIEVLGPRPFPMKESLKEYLEEITERQRDEIKLAEEKLAKEEEEAAEKEKADESKSEEEKAEESNNDEDKKEETDEKKDEKKEDK
jgi:AFG3 family protein